MVNRSSYDLLDGIYLLGLFVGICFLPLWDKYAYITTQLILPILFLISLQNGRLRFDLYIKALLLLYLFVLLSLRSTVGISDYLEDVKRFTGVVLTVLLFSNILTRNVTHIYNIMWIYVLKFIVMFCFFFLNDINVYSALFESRLRSGAEVGINANAFGYYSFIGVFAVALLLHSKRYSEVKMRALFYIISVMSIFINVVNSSRAGILITILSILSVFLITGKKLKIKRILGLSALLLAISMTGWLKIGFDINDLVVFKRVGDFASSGEDERVVILFNGLDVISKNPFGIGARQFRYEMLKYSNLGKVAATHNSFLTIAANYGLLALFPVILFLFSVTSLSIKLLKNKLGDAKVLGRIMAGMISLFIIYQFFYEMLFSLYILGALYCFYRYGKLVKASI